VCAAFARAGFSVRAVARRPTQVDLPGVHRALDVVTDDLLRPGAVAAACADSDVVIVAVADRSATGSWRMDGQDTARDITVRIPAAVIDSARRAAKPQTIILAGSVTQPRDGGAPASTYDELKQEAEDLILGAADSEIAAVSLRLPTVYGPSASPTGVDRGVVSAMTRRALRGEPLTLWNDGTPLRDPLFVADAADAFVLAVEAVERLSGDWWDVCAGDVLPVRELFAAVSAIVADVTGKPEVSVVRVDPPEFAAATDQRDGLGDPQPFRSRTGWRSRTPWPDGLERTVRHIWSEQATKHEGET
jgi:dTDP-4-keto-6-deoxyhexose 4-ketoreductase